MIPHNTIREVLTGNQEEINSIQVSPRDYTFDPKASYVLVGARRSGKSYILYHNIQQLLANGVDWDEMLYINFEDERLVGMETSDLNSIIEVHYSMSDKKPILFLDEIQIVPHWEKFVRRLADEKYRLFVTGSNAKMLSSEIATTLGGRLIVKDIFPYSFAEYITANGLLNNQLDLFSTRQRAKVIQLFNGYYRMGGFPESVVYEAKRDYLTSVYQKIYLGDIAARNNIENRFVLRLMFKKIAESICQPMSFNRLTNILKASGCKISVNTVINYIDYSVDAFLLFPIRNIADNLVGRETNPKYYFVDNGILNLLTFNNDTFLLENLVAVTLLRRYGIDQNVFFYNHNIEIDFFVPEEGLAIQVSYDISKSTETFDRETKAFVNLSKFLDVRKCLIITYSNEDNVVIEGIKIDIVPYWKWALGF